MRTETREEMTVGLAVTDILTFDGFMKHWAEDRPERMALQEGDRRYSYAELEERSAKVASMSVASIFGAVRGSCPPRFAKTR